MNWRTVDMSRESRRDQFAYFQTLSNPYVGVTVQVDVTELAVWCRERGTSFFLAVLYAAVRAANGVPELRRRIRGDQVVEYDRCPSSHPVALPDGTYCYCSLEVDRPFREFLPYAAAEQERVKAAPTLEDGEDGESLFFVSCVPWLSYTALTQPTPTPADSNPRITWGRWQTMLWWTASTSPGSMRIWTGSWPPSAAGRKQSTESGKERAAGEALHCGGRDRMNQI